MEPRLWAYGLFEKM